MQKKITEIVAQHAAVEIEAVTPEASLVYDLYIDSLILTEIVYALEAEFTIVVHDSEVANINTVGEICQLVLAKCPVLS